MPTQPHGFQNLCSVSNAKSTAKDNKAKHSKAGHLYESPCVYGHIKLSGGAIQSYLAAAT